MEKATFLILVALVAGCGSTESGIAPAITPTQSNVQSATMSSSKDAGVFISSARDADGKWVATTSKGSFAIYSSVGIPPQTRVRLNKYAEWPKEVLETSTAIFAIEKVLSFTE